jgi:hypothetical protein
MTEVKDKPAEKPIVTLAELYEDYGNLRSDLFELVELLPDGDLKDHILETDKRILNIIDGKVNTPLKCRHCEQSAQFWAEKAREKCLEMGLEEEPDNVMYALKCYIVQNAGSHPVS